MDNELLQLLVTIRKVLNAPYITLNDDAYFVFDAREAFEEIESGGNNLEPEDFYCTYTNEKIYYIAKVN